MMLTISFDGVGLNFGSQKLFDSLTVQLSSGHISAVTGSNGSGKSTFMKLAAKLIIPSNGAVSAFKDGIPLQKEAFRMQIAMVTPEMQLYQRLTAEENLRFLLGIRGITLHDHEISTLWDRVGLAQDKIKYTFAGSLSTGMRQRVKLAVLIASGADFWFLDEPGANLDEKGLSIVINETRKAASDGKLILWATNDPREEAAADAIIHLPWNQTGFQKRNDIGNEV